jgi:hypothetical protein
MTARPSLGKKLRFEVFKRDKFRCRYCGRRPPDVILVIDIIHPVAEGGPSDILNLATSCVDCNAGKGATRLSDDGVLQARYSELERLQEERDQLAMMLEWQRELAGLDETRIDQVANFWSSLAPSYTFSASGRQMLGNLLERFGVDEVCDAMRTSATRYLRYNDVGNVTADSWELATDKIGAIARVERDARDNPDAKTIAYTIGILRKRLTYVDNSKVAEMIKVARSWDVSPEEIYRIAASAHSWTRWRRGLHEAIDDHGYNEDETRKDD